MVGLVVLALCTAAAYTASTASAIKGGTHSAKIFSNCPLGATEAETSAGQSFPVTGGIQCIFGATEPHGEGGSFTVGSITVPFSKQVILQYGIGIGPNPLWNEEYCETHKRGTKCELENGELIKRNAEGFIPPTHGVSAIAPTPEQVPGEPIAHLTVGEQEELGWPESLRYSYAQAQKHGEVKKVYETIELAGIPVTSRANLAAEEGTAVEAPVKIKGENKWIAKLGDVCYIGSESEPIVQHLTSGSIESPLTHEVLVGSAGALEFFPPGQGSEAIFTDSLLVDNTYAVPGATCTGPYASYIEAAIDQLFMIPEPAGASMTQLKGSLYDGYETYVNEKLG